MKFLKALYLFLLLALCGSASAADKQFIEMNKSDTYFSLQIKFEKCDKVSTYMVQDGAMNTITVGELPPIRFIVKKNGQGVIKYYPVADEIYIHNGKKVPGLKIQGGLDSSTRDYPEAYRAAGLESLTAVELPRDSEKVKNALQNKVSKDGLTTLEVRDPVVGEERCCSGKGCGNTYFTFCTTGSFGCGGDGCGSCCIGGKG